MTVIDAITASACTGIGAGLFVMSAAILAAILSRNGR